MIRIEGPGIKCCIGKNGVLEVCMVQMTWQQREAEAVAGPAVPGYGPTLNLFAVIKPYSVVLVAGCAQCSGPSSTHSCDLGSGLHVAAGWQLRWPTLETKIMPRPANPRA